MKGKAYLNLNIFIISCILAIVILPGISSGTINIGGNSYATLENAVAAANPGDTLDLVSDTPVTLTPGNITAISKSLTIQQNGDTQFLLFVNGTIAFNGTFQTYTVPASVFSHVLSYDSTGPAVFRNNSLIEVTGSSNIFAFTTPHPALIAGAFTGTGVNVTGNNNSFSSWIGETKTAGGGAYDSHLSIVFNLSGSYNSISDYSAGSSRLRTDAPGGIGLNLIGNFNGGSGAPTVSEGLSSAETSPSIHIDSSQMSAPGGRVNVSPSASGNVIWDVPTSSPTVTIYNGTSVKSTTAWYFFNTSWAGQSGGNRNVTINVSQSIPFGGNVSLVANLSNITGLSNDYIRSTSLSLTSAGLAGGNIFNDTSTLKFNSISFIVPVRMEIGNNSYYKGTGKNEGTNLSAVTILNFNPYNSLPANNFNVTGTTNWSRIQDFTSAPNVTFVIENPTTHALLGNISFNQNLNLLNSVLISTGLQGMGSNISVSTAGNSTNLSVTTSGLSEFNKPATITMYPNDFSFATRRDITIKVTDDGGTTPILLYDNGARTASYPGYIDSSQNPTAGSGLIRIPVLHFSRFDFSRTLNSSVLTLYAGPGGDFVTLEQAMDPSTGIRDNDTLSLLSDVSVTATVGNLTSVNRTFNLSSNGYRMLVNGTISFDSTGKALTYNGTAWFAYDSSGQPFRNNTLIEIPGSSNFFNGTMPTIDAGSFTGTGVNITGNSNTLNAMWNISGSGMPIVVNLTGSGNTLNIAGNLSTTRTVPDGIAMNLLGNTNTLILNSQNLSGPGGRIWIGSTATGNTISDSGFIFPNIYLYNGTAVKATTAWYFFNASWSPSGRNRNPVINVSQTIPLAGNVSLISRFVNVTGQSTDLARNTSLALTTTGLAGGNIFNDTSALRFSSISAIVPVNLSFGDNTYAGSYQQKGLGSVTILNFNPVNSLPSKNFNVTRTTNWSFVPDFTAARNLTFVIEEPVAHTLLGNISYNQDLDLTDPAIGTGLSALSSNLIMAAAGNSIDLNIANTHQAFNKSATLTVYPTGFAFSSGSDIKITATTDSGAPTVLFNNGVWLNRAGFVDTNNNVSVGSGNITLPVLHFSKFDFDPASGGDGGGSTGGEGAGGGSSAGAPSSGIGTVTVNTQGSSAITQVEVTGVGVENIIVGAWAFNILPSSVTPATTAVYQYIAVIPNQYTEISNAIISFSVQKSWLEKNGYTKYDMTILRYSDGVWTPLPTVIVGEDLDFVKYQATSPGLSHFAIVYMKDAAVQAPVNVTATQTPVITLTGNVTQIPTSSSAVAEQVTGTPTHAGTIHETAVPAQSTPEVPPTTQKTPGFGTLIAAAAVVAACGGAWIASRKKRQYR